MTAPLRSRKLVAYGAAAVSFLLAWAVRASADTVLQDQASFNFFFLAVAVAAWMGGFRPALVTTAASCIVGNYYFSHPYGSLRITTAAELAGLSMFVMASVVIGVLAEISHQSLERAREAEKSKDEFMATLAHELRSPLSVIHYANSLDRLSPDQSSREHINLIDQQVHQLNHMIQDLLDVSRVARGKIRLDRQHLDASALVEGAVVKARPTIDAKGHTLTVSIDQAPLPVFVDPVRMEQVLANLLINAAKYTPNGGQISIRVGAEHGFANLSVRDNGVGIPAELLPRIFDLFVQADAGSVHSEGGLGIGLALVKKMVEMHEGRVRAISAGANLGSEFVVSLPLDVRTSNLPPASKRGDLQAAST